MKHAQEIVIDEGDVTRYSEKFTLSVSKSLTASGGSPMRVEYRKRSWRCAWIVLTIAALGVWVRSDDYGLSDLRLGSIGLEAAASSKDEHAIRHPDHFVGAWPENVVWGGFPIDRAPVLTIASGETVRIDTISQSGAANAIAGVGGVLSIMAVTTLKNEGVICGGGPFVGGCILFEEVHRPTLAIGLGLLVAGGVFALAGGNASRYPQVVAQRHSVGVQQRVSF